MKKATNLLKRGFTIIELMVVIAIIAVLATLITKAATGAIAQARNKRASVMAATVKSGIATYHRQKGEWPGAIENYAADGRSTTGDGLSGSEADSVIQAVVKESDKANPLMDASGLFVAKRSIANNSSSSFHGAGMDFGAARRQGLQLQNMAFGYQKANGDFARFKIKYDSTNDVVKVEL